MTINNPADHADLPGLLSPRKAPQQKRSQMLVKAIMDGCRKILDEEGLEHLTIQNLELVSGVCRGSIYQYFQSVDGVIARVFEEDLASHLKDWECRLRGQWETAGFEEVVHTLVECVLSCNRHLLRLNADFFRKHARHFNLARHYDAIFSAGAGAGLIEQVIREKVPGGDHWGDTLVTLRTHLYYETITRLCNRVMDTTPEFFDSRDFFDMLYALNLALLATPPAPCAPGLGPPPRRA